MSDLVSIITPVFNSENFIEATLNSVKNQSYNNWEHILVDDCSSDHSAKLIEELAKKDSRIKFVKLTENSGPAVARNKAIDLAKGRYLAFLDADDIWFDFHLKNSLDFMKSNDYDFVYASYKRSDENLNFIYPDFEVPSKVTYSDILKKPVVHCIWLVCR